MEDDRLGLTYVFALLFPLPLLDIMCKARRTLGAKARCDMYCNTVRLRKS